MCVAEHVCVCVCVCVGWCTCVRVLKACFCKSATSPRVCVCVCVNVCVYALGDWWSEAHTHHQQGICEVCESGAVIPLSLPKQRPRLLIYSKSLKSAYYCSSSSPSPSLSPHKLPLLPQNLPPPPPPPLQMHAQRGDSPTSSATLTYTHTEWWSAGSGTLNPFLTRVWK